MVHHRAGHYDKYIFNDQHRAKQYYSRLNEEEREERGYDNLGSTGNEQVRGGEVRGGAYDKYYVQNQPWAKEYCVRLEELAVGDCQGEENLGSGVHVRVNKEDSTEADETGVQLDRKRELLHGGCAWCRGAPAWTVPMSMRGWVEE